LETKELLYFSYVNHQFKWVQQTCVCYFIYELQ